MLYREQSRDNDYRWGWDWNMTTNKYGSLSETKSRGFKRPQTPGSRSSQWKVVLASGHLRNTVFTKLFPSNGSCTAVIWQLVYMPIYYLLN